MRYMTKLEKITTTIGTIAALGGVGSIIYREIADGRERTQHSLIETISGGHADEKVSDPMLTGIGLAVIVWGAGVSPALRKMNEDDRKKD